MYKREFRKPDEQRRVITSRAVILSESGQLELRKIQQTIMTEQGILTEDSVYSMIIEGEHITHPDQIGGTCFECNRYVTPATKLHCFYCGKIGCRACFHFDEKTQRWTCTPCRSSIRRKRFLRGTLKLLAFPFTRRRK